MKNRSILYYIWSEDTILPAFVLYWLFMELSAAEIFRHSIETHQETEDSVHE